MRLLTIATVAVGVALGAARPASAQSVMIIVNQSNPVKALSRDEVGQLFLKKTATWQTGKPVQPVDLAEGNPYRGAFSDQFLKKDPAAIQNYWKQAVFEGKAPPTQAATIGEVLKYVSTTPDAIGYVPGDVILGEKWKVKAVELR